MIGFVCDILKYGIKNDEGIFWLMRWMRKWVILVKINDDELEFYSVLKGYEFGGARIQIYNIVEIWFKIICNENMLKYN